MAEFKYAPMFQLGPDTTEYYKLTSEGVSLGEFEGHPILKVAPEALTMLANAAFRDVNFLLRPAHNQQVAKILSDPEASDNDKYVALRFLRNAEVSAKGKLPFCQDTGTAIIHGEKGQQVWTGFDDAEALSKGVYKTYTEENLRYSQNAPLDMYKEINTKCNLPAQIDIEAEEGMEYKFLCVVKGGGKGPVGGRELRLGIIENGFEEHHAALALAPAFLLHIDPIGAGGLGRVIDSERVWRSESFIHGGTGT